MLENAPVSPTNFFDHFRVSEDELCIPCHFNLGYMIRSWEILDTKRYPMLKALQKEVLKEWKKRPELHGNHKNGSIIEKHIDFLQMVMSLKFSLDEMHSKTSMMGVFIPGRLETVWTTPAMKKLELVGDFETKNTAATRNVILLHVVLHRIYGSKLDLSKLPRSRGDLFTNAVSFQPDDGSMVRYFHVKVDNELYLTNSWSIGLNITSEPPPLTQQDIDNILVKPFDLDHILSIFDPSCVSFDGCLLLTASDITNRHKSFALHKSLSKRDALRNINDFYRFQDHLREYTGVSDLHIGLLLSPFTRESKRVRWTPFLKSLRFEKGIDPSMLDDEDPYCKAWDTEQIINDLQPFHGLPHFEANGTHSLFICPLKVDNQFIGIFEASSETLHVFDYSVLMGLRTIAKTLAKAIEQVHEMEHERLMAVIQQTCTAIHPTVEWRFQEMARNYLDQLARDEIPQPEQVVFKDVTPLFGVSDIRGSSTMRNKTIQSDLKAQLDLASQVISSAAASHPRPVFHELLFRITEHQNAIEAGLKSGDEVRIYAFLDYVVASTFSKLENLNPETRALVKQYKDAIDPALGIIYNDRKSYDDSVTQINETIGTYIDRQQEFAQAVMPHYFEKYKTDGVDHNIYIGNSLLEEDFCCPIDYRDLYLWQLMTMCGVVWLMKDLKPKLGTPLDTAHLILVQSTPLSISFQMEEKHFNVDGAYNARYEIVKKRIDKAKIQKTGERLTQPGQIAIVYTQEKEAMMYKEFIKYLQSLGFIEEEYIDVLLEDLQGVHGLRAIRVIVKENAPPNWDPKKPNTSLGIR